MRLTVMYLGSGTAFTAMAGLLVMGLGGCATGNPGSEEAQGATAEVVSLPSSYQYVMRSSCGERGLLGRYKVTVRDAKAIAVTSLNPGYLYEPSLEEIPTLADLLEKAENAGPDAVVDLKVDDRGIPVSLAIDHEPTAIDDEECYEITDLHVE